MRDDQHPEPDLADVGRAQSVDGLDAWVRVAASADVPAGSVRTVDVDGEELVVWRGDDGTVVASDARCPHAWTHLGAQGVVHGCELVCLTHFWRFDRAGRGTTLDDRTGRRDERAPIAVRPCAEHDGAIFVARRTC